MGIESHVSSLGSCSSTIELARPPGPSTLIGLRAVRQLSCDAVRRRSAGSMPPRACAYSLRALSGGIKHCHAAGEAAAATDSYKAAGRSDGVLLAVIPRHLIIWRDPPVWPFVWRGLLPLCALAAVVLFAAGPFARLAIQSTVERELRGQLDAAGFGWVGLAVSGQSVKLAGVEPQSGAGVQALQLAARRHLPHLARLDAPAR